MARRRTKLASVWLVLLSVPAVACAHAGAEKVGEPAASGPSAVAPSDAAEPALPSTLLDTTPSGAAPGSVLKVAAGGALQEALDRARPGDVVELEAGATFAGNFTLPAKQADSARWIVIRSSKHASLPPGTRVEASQAGAMPKLVTPNPQPALRTAAGAGYYRVVGVEITLAPGVTTNYGLVTFGEPKQTSASEVPHDLILDRCYVHGNATANVSRGVALNSARTAVVDSNVSAVHGVGFDTQAICGWNGPGPFKIVNNYLEAAGENVMFGGADPKIDDLVPSDIEFRRNHCFKPMSWYAKDATFAGALGDPAKHWTVKNLFELKNARRVLVDGNVFQNCWVDGQMGFAVVLTPRNQNGTAPWTAVQDVTFTNNVVRDTAGGMNILGADDAHASNRTERVLVRNNLFRNIGTAELGKNGRLFQVARGAAHVTIDHVTGVQTGNVITFDGTPNPGFVFTNNVALKGSYGVIGSGVGEGTASLERFSPGSVFSGNVIVGGTKSRYPPGNFFPATIEEVGFARAGDGDFRLSRQSRFKGAAGGRDVGCDVDALQEVAGGAARGSG